MSKSDSISATSYWSRQKFKFKADAVHDDMSRLNYELMIRNSNSANTPDI